MNYEASQIQKVIDGAPRSGADFSVKFYGPIVDSKTLNLTLQQLVAIQNILGNAMNYGEHK